MPRQREAIIARLSRTVELLGSLADKFVFVGGSITPLLVTDQAAPDARITTDVDAVVQVLTRSEYQTIEVQLASVNFHLDPTEEVMCRFKHGNLILDVMPTHEEILKFGNQWYRQATEEPLSYTLPNERTINVINAPLFLCTKFVAYKDRGKTDEKDLEDIIAVVDGRRELQSELQNSSSEIKLFISAATKELMRSNFLSRIDWFLPSDYANSARDRIVINRLRALEKLSR